MGASLLLLSACAAGGNEAPAGETASDEATAAEGNGGDETTAAADASEEGIVGDPEVVVAGEPVTVTEVECWEFGERELGAHVRFEYPAADDVDDPATPFLRIEYDPRDENALVELRLPPQEGEDGRRGVLRHAELVEGIEMSTQRTSGELTVASHDDDPTVDPLEVLWDLELPTGMDRATWC